MSTYDLNPYKNLFGLASCSRVNPAILASLLSSSSFYVTSVFMVCVTDSLSANRSDVKSVQTEDALREQHLQKVGVISHFVSP